MGKRDDQRLRANDRKSQGRRQPGGLTTALMFSMTGFCQEELTNFVGNDISSLVTKACLPRAANMARDALLKKTCQRIELSRLWIRIPGRDLHTIGTGVTSRIGISSGIPLGFL